MGLENKTALIGIAIGFLVALVGVAMPLSFDIDPMVWRTVFCVGALVVALLTAWLLYEHLARRHPNQRAWALRSACLGLGIAVTGAATVWAAIAIPQPKNYGVLILAKLDVLASNKAADARPLAAAKPLTTEKAPIADRSATVEKPAARATIKMVTERVSSAPSVPKRAGASSESPQAPALFTARGDMTLDKNVFEFADGVAPPIARTEGKLTGSGNRVSVDSKGVFPAPDGTRRGLTNLELSGALKALCEKLDAYSAENHSGDENEEYYQSQIADDALALASESLARLGPPANLDKFPPAFRNGQTSVRIKMLVGIDSINSAIYFMSTLSQTLTLYPNRRLDLGSAGP